MKNWLRPATIWLALLALLTPVAPLLAATCPASVPSTLCKTVVAKAGSPKTSPMDAMPCCVHRNTNGAKTMAACCKPAPMPTSDNATPVLTHSDTASVLSQVAQDAERTFVVFTLPNAPLRIAPTGVPAFGDSPFDQTLPSQNAPATFAGRAPPLS